MEKGVCNMNKSDAYLIDPNELKYKDYTPLLLVFQKLILLPLLTEGEADQLCAIYEQAEKDSMLNFLLIFVEHILNFQLGLFSDDAIKEYKNQLAWLSEHLDQIPLKHENCKDFQQMLRDQGFYEGPIDGVLGDRSAKAIKQLNIEIQNLFSKRGLCTQDADGMIGEQLFKLLQALQQLICQEGGVGINPATFAAALQLNK